MKKISKGQKAFLWGVVLCPTAVILRLYVHPMHDPEDPIWRDAILIFAMFLSPLMVGLIVYWFREHYRVFYGAVEVYVGFIFAGTDALTTLDSISRVYVSNALFQSGEKYPDATAVSLMLLKVAVGLYVMVRGFDNIAQGLNNTGGERFWRWVSLKPPHVREPETVSSLEGNHERIEPDYPWLRKKSPAQTVDSSEQK